MASNDYIRHEERTAYWSDLFNALPRQTRDIAIAVEINHRILDLRTTRARLVSEHNAHVKELDDLIGRLETRLFVDFPLPSSDRSEPR